MDGWFGVGSLYPAGFSFLCTPGAEGLLCELRDGAVSNGVSLREGEYSYDKEKKRYERRTPPPPPR